MTAAYQNCRLNQFRGVAITNVSFPSLSELITTSNMYLLCKTYFLARRFLVFSSSSDSVDDDGVVLADVLTGEAGGSTFTAVPTLGALATLCIEPSLFLAPGGAKRLSLVMEDTSIWLTELCLRLRLLSPTEFKTKYFRHKGSFVALVMTEFFLTTSETPVTISPISINKGLSRKGISQRTETRPEICLCSQANK